ncbi:MAG: outer membrane beta-barrel protein [Proteobacteria bacterium]|nr:outer membrane beta-barrel protein [Pseudomonadota bacterium]
MVETNLERMGERPDSDFFGGHISAVGDFSEKLKGILQVGYQTRDFDRLSNGYEGDSHSLPIFEAELEYDFTDKRKASLTYKHGGRVSIESPDSAVTTDFFILKVNQQIGTTGKLSADFGTTYELDTYDTRDAREYQYLRMNAGISYSFNQWFKSSLRYDLEMFDSNKGNIDYNVNRVMLGLSVGY